jgi:uncharacterized CHY-type Zn-finger protein
MVTTHPAVRGVNCDPQTRCEHYRGPTDIIAIRMNCCGVYYACKDCHVALADHTIEVWPKAEWDQRAVLCGSCRAELTINQYFASQYQCPFCRAAFNPRCRNHYHFYFQTAPSVSNNGTGRGMSD